MYGSVLWQSSLNSNPLNWNNFILNIRKQYLWIEGTALYPTKAIFINIFKFKNLF